MAKIDKFETIKSAGAPLNHLLSMTLLHLASNLLNHQILPWKDIGKKIRKNILMNTKNIT